MPIHIFPPLSNPIGKNSSGICPRERLKSLVILEISPSYKAKNQSIPASSVLSLIGSINLKLSLIGCPPLRLRRNYL